ncbi:MAG: mercuric reductase [Chloroflexi bacterium]|nr:mercuric reductase [Chloroflexota bacterium]
MTTKIEIPPYDKYNAELVANAHPPEWVNPTPDGRYNLLVIGGGSGGLVAAAGAVGLGAKVALVEKHLLGGDCLNVGCVPSKTLIRSAKVVGDLRRGAEYGVSVTGVEVDFAAVMARVRRVRAEISHHDSAYRFQKLGIDVYLGDGQFTGPDSFTIDGRTIRFKKAVIATGSRPADLPIPGLAEAGYITNVTLFELTTRPQRLAVIGAGPIGAEMAQAFARLGSEVTVFDIGPTIAALKDAEGQTLIQAAFVGEGIQLLLESNVKQVERVAEGKRLTFEHKGVQKQLVVDEILLAVGRKANVEGLNLAAAAVQTNKKGLVVNDYLQTTNANIYGAGDVALAEQFTHTADASARIILRNALFLGRAKYSALTIPWTVYTDPEIAHVGLSPEDAAKEGITTDTWTTKIEETDRGRADGEDGFVKIYVRQGTDKIVGATIVARHAGEMISEITTAMIGGMGLGQMTEVIHPYPTQAEAIRKTAEAWNRTRLTPTVAGLFRKWLAWTR